MTAPAPQPTNQEAYIFNKVPGLQDLMPRTRGLPGVKYVQVTVGNQREAQDQGWLNVVGSRVYTVNGPKGRADMILMAQGRPIEGVGTESGARLCFIDTDVYDLTGFEDPKAEPDKGFSQVAPKAPGGEPSAPAPKPQSVAASQAGGS